MRLTARAFLPLLLLPIPLRAQDLAAYDVVFCTPSRDASGSMPIGNGEVGCNVWSEPGGKLCFYVSRTDSFSEASRLLKLGKVTVQVRAPVDAEFFEQRLVLRDGRIEVTWGEGDRRVALALSVDSDRDTVRVLADSAMPQSLTATVETWRTQSRRLDGEELQSSWTMKQAPDDVVVEESGDARVLCRDRNGLAVGFRHHNATSVVAFTAARQGLPSDAVPDVLRHRTFGLLASAAGAELRDEHPSRAVLRLPAAKRHELLVAAPCLVAEDPAAWDAEADRQLAAAAADTGARERTAAWWNGFWARSWIFVSGDAAAGVPANDHPLRVGVDSNGGNRFVGGITNLKITDGGEIIHAAADGELPRQVDALRGRVFTGTLRIEATVAQDPAHPIGRIVDKVTAGTSDGFLFDTHPGHALRLIVGDRQLIAANALPGGEPHRVAATFDPATGRMELWRDGELVMASEEPADPAPASRVTQALVLQRWIQACGGRGRFPIKFNGSIFTVEPKPTGGQPYDADWRKWGDCFWWQNTRLPYYPMLAQGDFDMQASLFRLYRDTLPVAIARAKVWHGAAGGYWPETMTPFGTHANGDYGWQRDGLPASKVLCPWWEYARNQGLELLALLLDRYDYERDAGFFRAEVLPIAGPVLDWFASAYPRTDAGELRIAPTQALETHWHSVENDLPTVAGLHWCLERLRTLAPDLVPEEQRLRWAALELALPPVPVREQDQVRLLAPAAKYDPSRQNCETPELYAVFPFRLYGLGKPDLEVARASFLARHDRFTNGWAQDGQDAALLGLVADAQANLLAKVRNHHRAHRFPAMWGPNFDWIPDQDHGSNLLDTAQRMLLQADGGRILLLPCWPKQWDVSFRLHAPQRTVVECVFRGGVVEKLEVEPAARRADVVLPQ
ncbi:MAG: hypothetical protein FJ265_06775 [Planctomycetes bacterium]|nr:hypothetical protein [Planctomycetota bacterium]